MSYDYSLFRAPGPGPMSSWGSVSPAPLGMLADVQRRLADLFPALTWRKAEGTCFGQSPAADGGAVEFQITPDEDGLCRFLTVRHISRTAVEGLCGALDVVAVDDQKMELIRAHSGPPR